MSDFSVSGGGDFYLLNPHSEKAFIWIAENTKLPFWDIPYCGISIERKTFINWRRIRDEVHQGR